MALNDLEPIKLERKGWKRPCPKCEVEILHTKLSRQSPHKTQFYDVGTNDVLIVDELPVDCSSQGVISFLDKESTEKEVNFKLWSNISCPNCGYEFPYAFQGLEQRLSDNIAVLIEGSLMFDRGKIYCITVIIDDKEDVV